MALKILTTPPTIIPGTAESPDFSSIPGYALASVQAVFDAGQYEFLPDPEPPPPDPDWTAFNLTLIPPAPGSQTTFEIWLEQFKIQHQTPLTSAAGLGNLEETQRLYDSLKEISQDGSTPQTPPTPEQVAEWQAVADACRVGVRF